MERANPLLEAAIKEPAASLTIVSSSFHSIWAEADQTLSTLHLCHLVENEPLYFPVLLHFNVSPTVRWCCVTATLDNILPRQPIQREPWRWGDIWLMGTTCSWRASEEKLFKVPAKTTKKSCVWASLFNWRLLMVFLQLHLTPHFNTRTYCSNKKYVNPLGLLGSWTWIHV